MPAPKPEHADSDVRMRGFAVRTTVEEAMSWIDSVLWDFGDLATEEVPLSEAATRVLARDVTSRVDVPSFARSMMDGFALRSEETHGATPYNALSFQIVGTCLPGTSFPGTVAAGQAVRIMTGAPLPAGADAVLPVENTEVEGQTLLAMSEVSVGKHVGEVGEDIRAGEIVLPAGRVLRPQDLGVLSSIGVSRVPVVRRPRVRILVTGNELLAAGTSPEGCRIADANGPMLAALVARDGGESVLGSISRNALASGSEVDRSSIEPDASAFRLMDSGLPDVAHRYLVADDPAAIRTALLEPADLVLVSGGSSVGQEDYAPKLVAELGELAIHGVAMRPSSPAGMGRIQDRLVFLLPGNPVSCLCAYDFFAGRAIRALAGRSRDWPYRRVRARLTRKLVSTVGRVDYARVQVRGHEAEPIAISGASILSSTTRADGFVIVPADSEGFPPGAEVEVFLY